MEIAQFLTNNEIYYLEHNKVPSVCTVETRNINVLYIDVGDRVFEIDDTYIIKSESSNSALYASAMYDSEFYIKILELTDAPKVFPNTLKTFNDFDVFVNTINEVILTTTAPDNVDVYSYTLDTNDNVLELIKTTVDGDLAFRENNDWTVISVDDESPTIFGQKIVDVDSNFIEKAITNYDTNQSKGKDLTLADVSEYVSVLAK